MGLLVVWYRGGTGKTVDLVGDEYGFHTLILVANFIAIKLKFDVLWLCALGDDTIWNRTVELIL